VTAVDLNTPLRQAVRRLTTGVTVLTVWHGDVVHGATISSITAISREPLLIGACLREESGLTEVIGAARYFAVNVLSARQSALADWFADPGRPRGWAQFDQVEWEPDTFSGAPWISDSLASLGCHLIRTIPAGDHNLLLGEVVTARNGDGAPLLHYAGRLQDGMLRILPREAIRPPVQTAALGGRS
jgi:flavin reductase